MSNNLPRVLTSIKIPEAVRVIPLPNEDELYQRLAKHRTSFDGTTYWGTAYLQGGRLQFITAMPTERLLQVTRVDRAKKADTILAVMERSNRPGDTNHGRKLSSYVSQ